LSDRCPIRIAEHVILDQLTEHYPAHLSKDELVSVIRSKVVDAEDVEDALARLLAQRLIHRQGDAGQGDADCYWLARAVRYIQEISWEPGSICASSDS
jgi:hypothetical protein